MPAVRWQPFQLNPDIPATGMSRSEYIERKWGKSRGPDAYSRVAAVGTSVGIPFAFDKIAVQPNTLEAHRLLTYAERHGRQNEVAEVLFKAYFIDGANLTDVNTLADIGASGGLDRDALHAYLVSDEDRTEVSNADISARSAGIGGVPFFIFNRRIGVSGAQDADVLLEAMEQASRTPAPASE
jgi:predicted DsbA family dithiol-disulfide isomerase